MTQIPSIVENPDGLHRRYNVSRADGSPVDPNAVYFVLRLDGGGKDPAHIAACRAGALAYVNFIQNDIRFGSGECIHLNKNSGRVEGVDPIAD